jgi:putative pyruvate formate lyase activating enzyme
VERALQELGDCRACPRWVAPSGRGGAAGSRRRVGAARAARAAAHAAPRLPPRSDCGVDRAAGKLGVCGVGRNAVVATIAPHYGEEACLQGWLGSGTVFFSGCSMRCRFCQNWDISHRPKGFELTAEVG